jgi:hypothetical protein
MLAAIACAVQLAGAQPCAPAAIAPDSIAEWSRNIAVVEGPKGRGRGVVVGWVPGLKAWIAVPAHVVFGDAKPVNPETYRTGLNVRLFGDTTPRELCPTSGPLSNPRPPLRDLDLTFVCVNWSTLPLFSYSLPARDVRTGDPVELLRGDAGEQFAGTVAGLRDLGKDGNVQVSFRGVPTMSGSPVVGPAGVVGLLLGADDTPSGGRLLSMRAIQAKAQAAAIPWQLVENESFDCNRARRVCVTVESGVTPPGLALQSVFRLGSANVAPGACVDLPEGKYELKASGGATCEPRYVSLYAADDALQLALDCQPALGGMWHTADGDWLSCLNGNLGSFTCSGLFSLGNGMLEATFTTGGARVSVSGSFVSPTGTRHPASGNLVWSGGRLSGQIRREQYPAKTIELTKEETR